MVSVGMIEMNEYDCLSMNHWSALYLAFIEQARYSNEVREIHQTCFISRNLSSFILLHPWIVHPANGCPCLLAVVTCQSLYLCR